MKGVVVGVNDPEKRGRVLVSCPDMMLDPESGAVVPFWCEPVGGSQGGGHGSFGVPAIGSPVWVSAMGSEDTGIERTFYSPGQFYGDNAAPLTARGEEDRSTGVMRQSANFKLPSPQNRLGISGRRDATNNQVEVDGIPESFNAGEYPYVRTTKTLAGFIIEMDDTPGAARVSVWHPSGACYEISATGAVVQRSTRQWDEVLDNSTSVIGGDLQQSVAGNMQTAVAANRVAEIRGREFLQAGEVNIKSRSHVLVEAANSASLKIGGNYDLSAAAGLQETVVGDRTCTVAGSISNTAMLNYNVVAAKVCESSTAHNSICANTFDVTSPVVSMTSPSVLLGLGALADGVSLVKHPALVEAFTAWVAKLEAALAPVPGLSTAALTEANAKLITALTAGSTINVRAM